MTDINLQLTDDELSTLRAAVADARMLWHSHSDTDEYPSQLCKDMLDEYGQMIDKLNDLT